MGTPRALVGWVVVAPASLHPCPLPGLALGDTQPCGGHQLSPGSQGHCPQVMMLSQSRSPQQLLGDGAEAESQAGKKGSTPVSLGSKAKPNHSPRAQHLRGTVLSPLLSRESCTPPSCTCSSWLPQLWTGVTTGSGHNQLSPQALDRCHHSLRITTGSSRVTNPFPGQPRAQSRVPCAAE